MSKLAQIRLESGAKYPYDHDGDSSEPVRPAKDWAEAATRGVLSDLSDRRGIKWELEKVDQETRIELVASLAEIIRLAHKNASTQAP